MAVAVAAHVPFHHHRGATVYTSAFNPSWRNAHEQNQKGPSRFIECKGKPRKCGPAGCLFVCLFTCIVVVYLLSAWEGVSSDRSMLAAEVRPMFMCRRALLNIRLATHQISVPTLCNIKNAQMGAILRSSNKCVCSQNFATVLIIFHENLSSSSCHNELRNFFSRHAKKEKKFAPPLI